MIISTIIMHVFNDGKRLSRYALVLSTWHAVDRTRLTMAGHMAKQGDRWLAIGLKWAENGRWPAVIFISALQ